MSPSDWAAWYGAIVATGVAAWDVVKWTRTGPRITATAQAGMIYMSTPQQRVTYYRCSNTGDRATTLTGVGFHVVKRGARVHKRSILHSAVVNKTIEGMGRWPKRLEPGDVWSTGFSEEGPQAEEYRTWLDQHDLYAVFNFSHLRRELRVKVVRVEQS